MKHYFSVCLLVMALFVAACGKKGDPLPQKVDQLFSLQNVFLEYNPEGTLTVHGSLVGYIQNVQAFELQLEAVDEDCISCPFIPVRQYSKTPQEVWGSGQANDFSFTVFPYVASPAYRWRLVVHNAVSGLPNATTPVYKVHAPFADSREFVEMKQALPDEQN